MKLYAHTVASHKVSQKNCVLQTQNSSFANVDDIFKDELSLQHIVI